MTGNCCHIDFVIEDDQVLDFDIGDIAVLGGDKFFAYSQMTPSDRWEINHPLDKYPSVTIVDSGGSIVVGDVDYVDNKTIIIIFQSAFSGKAYLN